MELVSETDASNIKYGTVKTQTIKLSRVLKQEKPVKELLERETSRFFLSALLKRLNINCWK